MPIPCDFLVLTSNLPKIPSLSMFGPAVKYSELVFAPLLPLPKTSAHSPSTFSGLPFLIGRLANLNYRPHRKR